MEQTASKRIGATAAMVLLVALAGCSGLGLGGDGGGDGYGVSGADLDGETLDEATTEAVESAGSYTVEQSSNVTISQASIEVTTTSEMTIQVDFESEQGLRERQQQRAGGGGESQASSSVVYTDGDTSYRKQTIAGNTSYDTREGEGSNIQGITAVNVTDFPQNYAPVIDGVAWEQNGTETRDGTTVTVYTATGVENRTAFGLPSSTTVTNGELLVDGDGVVRELTLGTSDEQRGQTLDVTVTLTETGSTTVEEPGWLDNATSS